jgi:hypothetical protein
MGIKDFTKVFDNSGEFKYNQFKDKHVVIDASIEIYRAALGMKMSEQLTNSFGVPTSHINTILLGVILKLKASGAKQYWIFDNSDVNDNNDCHNPLKQLELKKRKEKRAAASVKIEALKKQLNNVTLKEKNELFSDSESDECDTNARTNETNARTTGEAAKINDAIDKQEKVAFKMEPFYMIDTIFLLDMLDIPWVKSPSGFEAEHLCALSTINKNIFGVKMDYVFSPDSDALIFGAKKLIKRDIRKKKLFEYDLKSLLGDNNLTLDELIKIALILGCDFAPKTPRIGIKTVLKKFKDVVLSDEQNIAFQLFKKELTQDELNNIVVYNSTSKPFSNNNKYKQLLDWLVLVKNYNRDRIVKQFDKQKLFNDKTTDKVAKT